MGRTRVKAPATIPLAGGQVALVDPEDATWIGRYQWHVGTKGYPEGRVAGVKLTMHRLIMDAAPGQIVVHLNGDPLDNRRANLRLTDSPHHVAGRSRKQAPERRSSQYKGVSWVASKRKWYASIQVEGKTRNLGYYDSEEAAAAAYDRAAQEHFGEFARLNLPGDGA
jgi:hypothetical protein